MKPSPSFIAPATSRFGKGFTLLELLIVVAIVGVVAALLLGAAARAKAKAQQAACQSNLRQLALAMRMYQDDSAGRFPVTPGWTKKLLPYVSGQIFQCPSNPRPRGNPTSAMSPASFDATLSDFWMSRGLNRVVTNGAHLFVVGINESMVWEPTETLMFGDIAGPLAPNSNGQTEWSVIHSGGANYCFVDGHITWLTPAKASLAAH